MAAKNFSIWEVWSVFLLPNVEKTLRTASPSLWWAYSYQWKHSLSKTLSSPAKLLFFGAQKTICFQYWGSELGSFWAPYSDWCLEHFKSHLWKETVCFVGTCWFAHCRFWQFHVIGKDFGHAFLQWTNGLFDISKHHRPWQNKTKRPASHRKIPWKIGELALMHRPLRWRPAW